MNETTLNNSRSMYEEVAEVAQLNKVEGFDPRKYMRQIVNEGQSVRFYLDVAYRKLWFRLKYPNGKIVKKLIKLTDEIAVVEAKIYLDRNDTEENFISNALAQKCKTEDDRFGNKFVEMAETAAVGRALSDAGFGLQFADKEMDFDEEVTEAPIEEQILSGGCEVPDFLNMPAEGMEEVLYEDTMPPQMAAKPSQPNSSQKTKTASASSSSGSVSEIKTNLPVEDIYKMLNRDKAAAVVVPVGFNKGKTLGQVAVEKPDSLHWYVESYGGPNNLLRAAAKYLLDAAFSQAG